MGAFDSVNKQTLTNIMKLIPEFMSNRMFSIGRGNIFNQALYIDLNYLDQNMTLGIGIDPKGENVSIEIDGKSLRNSPYPNNLNKEKLIDLVKDYVSTGDIPKYKPDSKIYNIKFYKRKAPSISN
jgi:hypothetical protein